MRRIQLSELKENGNFQSNECVSPHIWFAANTHALMRLSPIAAVNENRPRREEKTERDFFGKCYFVCTIDFTVVFLACKHTHTEVQLCRVQFVCVFSLRWIVNNDYCSLSFCCYTSHTLTHTPAFDVVLMRGRGVCAVLGVYYSVEVCVFNGNIVCFTLHFLFRFFLIFSILSDRSASV